MVLLLPTLIFFIAATTTTAALSFNFTTFTNDNRNITYEQAFAADNSIQLTRNLLASSDLNISFGRATYSSALPLWHPISHVIGGRKTDAWITYDPTAKNLTVAVTGLVENVSVIRRLSYIVDLRDYLPEEVIFGFSGATGNQSAVHRIHSWQFSSTLEEIVLPNPKSEMGVAIGSTVVVCVSCLICILLVYRKRNDDEDDDEEQQELNRQLMDEILGKGAGPRKFTFKELAKATNNFSDSNNKLGEGGFGGVYRGFINDNDDYIAVKRVSKNSKQGIKEFAAEVKIISRLRHRNLVQLIGWCYEKKELLLVYEFLPNGSLDMHLFRNQSVLRWETRYKIAKGLASALLYLHEEWEQCVVHRDIKSSNVMLDSNFNVKLGDFGLARLVDHDKGSQTTRMAGTMGYLAPECASTGKANKESDIYSFGVVLLEIATGRRPAVVVEELEQYAVHLTHWVWDLYRDGRLISEGSDSKLEGDFEEKEMERLMMIGLSCAHPNAKFRPSVRRALQVLNFEAPLPVLPLNRPVASYVSGPSMAFTNWSSLSSTKASSSSFMDSSSSADGGESKSKSYFSCEVAPSRLDGYSVDTSSNMATTF
ncbi:L-type lectin-domain containing receptor kinase IX.1 [Linum grandiflorum]